MGVLPILFLWKQTFPPTKRWIVSSGTGLPDNVRQWRRLPYGIALSIRMSSDSVIHAKYRCTSMFKTIIIKRDDNISALNYNRKSGSRITISLLDVQMWGLYISLVWGS